MNETAALPVPKPEDQTSVARVRILVVDDSPVSRAYILEALRDLVAVEVTAVESGAQALRAVKLGGYSLLLCDYEMPDMSGLHVLRFVRANHTALELPVLMLTSRDEGDIKVRALRAGANDYIAKQAQPEELRARVGTQIELLAAHRRLVEARLHTAEGQKFEAIGHLSEALAHELNTPAQYIGDNLSFLKESWTTLQRVIDELRAFTGPVDAGQIASLLEGADCDYFMTEVPRCIDESRQGIDQVARIVAVMREFARRGTQELAPHDLNEIIRGAVAVTRGQLHQVAELELELESKLPTVPCVATAIKQVVLYALMNAVKALTPTDGQHGTRGRLKIRSFVEGETWVAIEIADTGRSIPSDVIAKVFDPVLGNAHLGETAQALQHARTVIVGEHDGKLEIISDELTGTRILMRLPQTRERVSRRVAAPPRTPA